MGLATTDLTEVFPARAGMSPSCARKATPRGCFPRPRGDEPWEVLEADFQMTFSPPARG